MRMLIAVIVIAAVIFYFYTSSNNQKAALENIEKGKAFLAENKTKEGVQETPSGLQYLVLESGDSDIKPKATDSVTVHYHGTLIDGSVFDSSVNRNQTIDFPLNRVIKGWTEGLQLMAIGDKYRFFIPADLGYGNRSAGSIPAGSLLIFDVELIAVN